MFINPLLVLLPFINLAQFGPALPRATEGGNEGLRTKKMANGLRNAVEGLVGERPP